MVTNQLPRLEFPLLARLLFCIQNVDVPVGPTGGGGLAVVLRLPGIKTGPSVGSTRIVGR